MPSRLLDSPLLPAPARRVRRKEARPGELIEAALDLFVEKGFAATRSEEVAARAGVSKGTLFLYFPSKEELFKAVVTESIAGRFAEWNEEYDAFTGSTSDMLRYCLHTWWERIGSTKVAGITKLMMAEGRNFPELAAFYRQEVVRPGQMLVRRILQRGIDSGEFEPMDLDNAVYTVIAPVIFLTLAQHAALACIDEHAPLDPQRYLATQSEALLRGLCTPAGRETAAATAHAPYRPPARHPARSPGPAS